MMMQLMRPAALALILALSLFASQSYGQLKVGFYKGKCGSADVEAIVAGVIKQRFAADPTILPALLRLHFHDCFVSGCDASILLDGDDSEKMAGPNQSVRGYEVIDAVKAAVEKRCPGLVSCADIIALATRDAVVLGKGSRYNEQTGRRDGRVSNSADAQNGLPGPDVAVSQLVRLFSRKGLTASDAVLLLGAHTVGITHCSFITDRLYDFQNTGRPDPSMDPALARALRRTCPQAATVDSPVNLDQNVSSSNTVDASFYRQLQLRRGILEIDQNLASDVLTRQSVSALASGAVDFQASFGKAMIKMGSIGVLTGQKGEIRKSCRAINRR
uniref:Peroxidase n=1 Tax=Kalanchoe fedtschenkoi TaxID=63787 RepID=A0A7N0RFI7_KALFE